MTYKALVKTAESYLYDAQSDLQALTKRLTGAYKAQR